MDAYCPKCEGALFETGELNVAPYTLMAVYCKNCRAIVGVVHHPNLVAMIEQLYDKVMKS